MDRTSSNTPTVYGGNAGDSNATVYGGNMSDSNATVYGGNVSDSNATVYGGNTGDSNATVYSAGGNTLRADLPDNGMFDEKYRIVSKISNSSSQANVYLAECTDDGSQVVLKVFNSDFEPSSISS